MLTVGALFNDEAGDLVRFAQFSYQAVIDAVKSCPRLGQSLDSFELLESFQEYDFLS
jgi:hypothetical protein